MNEEQLLDLYGFTRKFSGETSGIWIKKDVQVALCYTRKHVAIFKLNGILTITSGMFYSSPSELLSIVLQYV